jgi:hypothetical protein
MYSQHNFSIFFKEKAFSKTRDQKLIGKNVVRTKVDRIAFVAIKEQTPF